MRERRKFVRNHKQSVLILAGTIALTAALAMQEREEPAALVERQAEGGGAEERTFSYQIDGGALKEVTIPVSPQQRSAEQIQELLAEAAAEWEDGYLGENRSANHVCRDLNLPLQFCGGLVTADYESSDYSVLGADGTVSFDHAGEEGTVVNLTATFHYGDVSRQESRWLKVVLPDAGSAERLKLQLTEKLTQEEAATREDASFSLPDRLGGHQVSWKREDTPQWIYVLCLGIFLTVCLEWRQREHIRQAKKERETELLFEYPQLVEQMSLLLGSGMTIRGAWERILRTDQKLRGGTGQTMRSFVEEMWITYREIFSGCGEREAYEKFGARIGLIPYRRFASILSQNLSKGTRDVCRLLKAEALEALEMRKNHARRLGEEAGTKMLFPMLLMFLLILMVLLTPAIQSF